MTDDIKTVSDTSPSAIWKIMKHAETESRLTGEFLPDVARKIHALFAPSDLVSIREENERLRRELEIAALFQTALRIAHSAHDGQTDKTGAAYILHPIRVSLMGECADDRIVGLLHDVVEDCPQWPLERLREHFPPHITEAVEALTKRDGEDYMAFIERVKLNEIAARVKLNDIADNMDPRRLDKLPLADAARLQRKYSKALRALSADGKEGRE